jgi:hypothetical protein
LFKRERQTLVRFEGHRLELIAAATLVKGASAPLASVANSLIQRVYARLLTFWLNRGCG